MTTTMQKPQHSLLILKGDKAAIDLEVKGVGVLEIKDAEKGEVEAIIATLGVVDRDGDVIHESAIKSGSKVKMSAYGHDAVWGETPVGKGQIVIDGNKAIFKGKLFLSTARGRETFGVLKEMGADQEWSFGFAVKGHEVPDDDWKKKGAYRILTKLEPFEVSPVMRGAGVGTHTVGVKEDKPADQPVPTPEEVEAKARAEAEAKAATERAAIARQAKARDAAEEAQRVMRNLRRLGYVT